MDTVHGFWVGAMSVAKRIDLGVLAERCGGWNTLVQSSVDDLIMLGIPYSMATAWLRTPPLTTKWRAITRACPEYPSALRVVPGAPPLLFAEGDLTALAAPGVSVVGTRQCSPYGSGTAHHVAAAAARAGCTVISGLARGIDSAAHRGTLAVGGRTIAVLGHGLSHTSPMSHRSLREQIVRGGGLLLTTHPDTVPPARWTFPERNRWIAALAHKLVLVEAPAHSGALITVERWLDLGRERELYVVPGPLGAESWQGSAALLAMGAQPLADIQQLLSDLNYTSGMPLPDWLAALFRGDGLDDVAKLRGIPAVELLREIVMLELRGELVRLPGGRYAAAGGIR